MERYEKYKDSGVEWIGEIPEHWDVKRFNHTFEFSRGLPITKSDLKKEGIPCVSYGEIHSRFGFSVSPEIHPLKCVDIEYLDSGKKSLLKKGDFVFADTSEDFEGSGNFTCLDSDTPTFAGYHTIVAKLKTDCNYKYVAYFVDSLQYRSQIRSRVSGIKVYSITQQILKDTALIFPPLPEQDAIANYLDRKIAEIDALIAKKKRLLELYEEEKTAIINHAVTKGINPDAPMKDSGIPWLGEVPAHWELIRMKRICELTQGNQVPLGDQKKEYFQNSKLFIRIENYTKNSEDYRYVDFLKSKVNYVYHNDVIMVRYGASAGKVVRGLEGVIANNLFSIRSRQDIIKNEFLYHFLSNLYWYFQLEMSGSAMPAISFSMLDPIIIAVAPMKEQDGIMSHIKLHLDKFKKQKDKINKEISLLTEYRSSLISDVVTGKVKVHEGFQ